MKESTLPKSRWQRLVRRVADPDGEQAFAVKHNCKRSSAKRTRSLSIEIRLIENVAKSNIFEKRPLFHVVPAATNAGRAIVPAGTRTSARRRSMYPRTQKKKMLYSPASLYPWAHLFDAVSVPAGTLLGKFSFSVLHATKAFREVVERVCPRVQAA